VWLVLQCFPHLCAQHVCQDPESNFIKDIKITRAKGKSYITGIFGASEKKHLVVEISEKMSANHRELIEDIASKLKSGKYTKEDALNMRAQLLKAGGCK
jgi:hypothetical protein